MRAFRGRAGAGTDCQGTWCIPARLICRQNECLLNIPDLASTRELAILISEHFSVRLSRRRFGGRAGGGPCVQGKGVGCVPAAMDPKSNMWDVAYKLLMRRNSVYVAFIFVGAIAGERAVDYTFNKMWEKRNRGKLFEDIPGLGTKTAEAD